jgi:hypothetical protein
MGWTGTHREPGLSDRAFFEAEFPTMLRERGEIVACSTVQNVFYAAVRDRADGQVWALVVLIQRGRGWFNFTYKEMDEAMGPGYVDAPAAVLDALTGTDKEWAIEWRKACREQLAAKAARPKVRRGALVTFDRPLSFGNGDTLSTLRFVERTTFEHPERPGQRYRVSRWRDRQHAVAV